MPSVSQLQQAYWFSPQLPQLECRSTWNSAQAYKTHSHAQLSLGVMVAGSTLCHYRGTPHHLQAGELVLIDPHAPHSCNPLPGQTRSYHMLYVDVRWCLTLLANPTSPLWDSLCCQTVCIRDQALFRRVLQLVDSLYRQDMASATVQLTTLFRALLPRFCLPVQSTPQQYTTHYVRQRLLANLQQPPSLVRLAQELNLRRETVLRHFRDDTGTTPMAFLNNARIEYAKTLLKQGASLADAGYQSGFSDQSHFHKIFVLHTAATPGQYRQASDNIR